MASPAHRWSVLVLPPGKNYYHVSQEIQLVGSASGFPTKQKHHQCPGTARRKATTVRVGARKRRAHLNVNV